MLEANEKPYEKVRKILDQRLSHAFDQTRNWRVIAFCCLILLSFSLIGNIYLGRPSRQTRFIVAVHQNGETNALNPATELSAPVMHRAISFFLSRFVMLAREIPADPVLLRDNMGKLFQLVSMQGKTLLTEKLKEQRTAL